MSDVTITTMAKLYTRTGDGGEAGLVGGQRLPKDDALFEAIGTVDELNAAMGWVAVSVDAARTLDSLRRIQRDLFSLGAALAGYEEGGGSDADRVRRLESEIDAWSAQTPPLDRFVLPGGSEASSRLHLARTVARRAERRVVALQAHAGAVCYLNRLSDWLFALARFENHDAGHAEIVWEADRASQ